MFTEINWAVTIWLPIFLGLGKTNPNFYLPTPKNCGQTSVGSFQLNFGLVSGVFWQIL
jgi:hypothetical protein